MKVLFRYLAACLVLLAGCASSTTPELTPTATPTTTPMPPTATDAAIPRLPTPTQLPTVHTVGGFGNAFATTVGDDGLVWFVGPALTSFDGTNWEVYYAPLDMHIAVEAAAIGPDGALWQGGRFGIIRFLDGVWTLYGPKEGVVYNWISGIDVAPDGTVWASAVEGHVYRFDGQVWTEYDVRDQLDGFSEGDWVYDVAISADGIAWFATEVGVLSFHPQQEPASAWTYYGVDNFGATGCGELEHIRVAPDGTIWVAGFYCRDVYRFDGLGWERLPVDDGRSDGVVDAIGVDAQSRLWAVTEDGAYRFDGENWEQYNPPLEYGATSAVVEPSGNAWFSWNGETARLDEVGWTVFEYDQAVRDNVQAMWDEWPNLLIERAQALGDVEKIEVLDGVADWILENWRNHGREDRVLATITDPQEIQLVVDALTAASECELGRTRCGYHFKLRFYLTDGTQEEFVLGSCDARFTTQDIPADCHLANDHLHETFLYPYMFPNQD